MELLKFEDLKMFSCNKSMYPEARKGRQPTDYSNQILFWSKLVFWDPNIRLTNYSLKKFFRCKNRPSESKYAIR